MLDQELIDIQERWLLFASRYIFEAKDDDIYNVRNLCHSATQKFHRAKKANKRKVSSLTNEAEIAEAEAEAMVLWGKSSVATRTPLVSVIYEVLKQKKRKVANSLDLACGQCSILSFLRKEKVIRGRIVAIDASTKMIEEARALTARCNVKAEFHLGLLDNLPFRDIYREKFDLVLHLDALQWCENWPTSLLQMEEVMAEDGIAFIVFQFGFTCPGKVAAKLKSYGLQILHLAAIDSGDRCLMIVQK